MGSITSMHLYDPVQGILQPELAHLLLETAGGDVYLFDDTVGTGEVKAYLKGKVKPGIGSIRVLLVEGLQRKGASTLDRFQTGEAWLEVITLDQITAGDVSTAVARARVVQPGVMALGMSLAYCPRIFQVHILTLSDRAYRGEYTDRGGPEVERLSREFFHGQGWKAQFHRQLLPDDTVSLLKALQQSLEAGVDVVIATGGTGVGPRDNTPEGVRQLIEKEIPGIMEMIRMKHGATMPRALLSRAIAGVSGETLVYAIPGSLGAVRDYMEGIHQTLAHLLFMVRGIDVH